MSRGMQRKLSHSIGSGVFSSFSVAEKPRATDFVDEKRKEKQHKPVCFHFLLILIQNNPLHGFIWIKHLENESNL